MKSILKSIIALAILVPNLHAKADDKLFQYPEAPASLTTLEERTSYVIEHFWDRCNINQAFSTRSKLQQAFNDYIDIMPYADATVVHESVNKLLERIKKNPAQILAFAEMAEGAMYSDTASVICDEVYYPFAQAVVDCKKIKPADKERFINHARILSGSQVGMTAPDFKFTTVDGETKRFSELPAGYVIFMIYDPANSECMMTRVRLSADYNINEFIKKGQLNVVCIYPGEATDEAWVELSKRMPDNWITGSSSEIKSLYDMRITPAIYYMNSRHKILSKTMTADQLINAFREINTRSTANSTSETE